MLNLGVESGKYSYVADPGEIVPTARGNESQCGAAGWAAERERYLWLDLAAGPVTLGPRLSGEGAVVANSIPRFDVRAAADSELLSSCASLSALIHRTVVHFVMSPLLLPVKSAGGGKVTVPIVRICESEACSFTSRTTWKRMEALVREMGGEGDVTVEHHLVAAHDSPGVLVAVLQAMRSTRVGANVHRFLDSEVLARAIRASPPPYSTGRGRGPDSASGPNRGSGSSTSEVPVYVLDLDTADTLLFEGMHQTVAFDDMVLSIQASPKSAPSATSLMLQLVS